MTGYIYSPQVFDATNSTADRRRMIHEIVVKKMGYKLFFVESVCDDPKIIEQNIMVSVIYDSHETFSSSWVLPHFGNDIYLDYGKN